MTASYSSSLGLPERIPETYGSLVGVDKQLIRSRLQYLLEMSEAVYSSWRFLDLCPKKVEWFILFARYIITTVTSETVLSLYS